MTLSLGTRIVLWPLSWVYGKVAELRAWMYAQGWLKQRRLNGAVISVGNLTVGGTGKTPMVIWLAEKYVAAGCRVAILSRGYRGKNGTSDEIALMKERLKGRVAFGVGKNRYAAGQRTAANQSIDIFLLDDGFQHLQLARDVDIVLIDASRQLGKEWLLPAGRMRERVSALFRADIAVFTRIETAPEAGAALQKLTAFPVFAASTALKGFRMLGAEELLTPLELGAGPFTAFCGIGNPQSFFRDLEKWGIGLKGRLTFPDHFKYKASDVSEIEADAASDGSRALITTEKDAQNLPPGVANLPVYVAVIDMQVDLAAEFLGAIDTVIQSRRKAVA